MNAYRGCTQNRCCRQFAVALAITVAVIALVIRPLCAGSVTPPLIVVKQLVTRVLSIVNDKQMEQADKQKKLRELGAADFDFSEMSRLALGNAWRSLTTDQRHRFVPLFTSFLQDAYLNKVQNYSGQEIQIIRARSTEPDYAQVSGRIVQQGSDSIALAFSLRREGGAWKIYDVAVDNLSTLGSYRTEFQRIMREKGFDELMRQIRDRDRELASTLGSPMGLPF